LANQVRLKTKSEHSFVRNVLISSLAVLLIAAYPAKVYLNQLQIVSFICGFLVSLINAFVGYRLNEMALNKSVKSFMIVIFGGMGIRILIMAILLLVLLKIAGLDEVSLVGSAFLFYVIFVSLEILYFHTRQSNLKTENSALNKDN
jgi:hypothetical protein